MAYKVMVNNHQMLQEHTENATWEYKGKLDCRLGDI